MKNIHKYNKIIVKDGKILNKKKKHDKLAIKKCLCYKCNNKLPKERYKFCCKKCQEAQYRKYGKILNECYNIIRSYKVALFTGKI